jgi:hypothetical protein
LLDESEREMHDGSYFRSGCLAQGECGATARRRDGAMDVVSEEVERGSRDPKSLEAVRWHDVVVPVWEEEQGRWGRTKLSAGTRLGTGVWG